MTERPILLPTTVLLDATSTAEMWALRIETGAMDDPAWMDFTRWIQSDPRHQLAFEQVQAWLGEVDQAAAQPDLWPAPRQTRSPRPTALPRPAPMSRFAMAASLTGALVLAGGVGASLGMFTPQVQAPQVFETADRGLSVTLPDQSDVALSAHSGLTASFDAQRRRVALRPGSEADFDVRHETNRPFEISAGPTQVRVLGTAFDVKYLDGLTRISVSRGAVQVADADRRTTLTVGQSLAIRADGQGWTVSRVANTAAWRQGRLIYDRQPLFEVCADIARATNRPVDVAPALRDLTFTGVLKIGRPDEMARTLALYLPIGWKQVDGRIEFIRRSGDGAL